MAQLAGWKIEPEIDGGRGGSRGRSRPRSITGGKRKRRREKKHQSGAGAPFFTFFLSKKIRKFKTKLYALFLNAVEIIPFIMPLGRKL